MSVPAVPPPAWQSLVQQGDAARDAGHWAAAARAYRAAIEAGCNDPAIDVQLGNMLKESGEWVAAAARYREALAKRPEDADAWLQLGHCLKLLGRRAPAAEAYQRAFALDPRRRDSMEELLALGEAWRLGEAQPRALDLLEETLHAVRELRRSLAIIEARLPMLESFATVKADRFEHYLARYRCPAAPGGATPPIDLLLRPGEASVGQAARGIAETARLLRAAPLAVRSVDVETEVPELIALAKREFGVLFRPEVAVLTGWVLVLAEGAVLRPEAIGWFSQFAARVPVETCLLLGDEVQHHQDGRLTPVFLPGYDPMLLAAAGHLPVALCIRREVLRRAGAARPAALMAAAGAEVLHLPVLLADRPPATAAQPVPIIASPAASVAPRRHPIRVIISSRAPDDLLAGCYESARRSAAAPGSLHWTVIDNRDVAGPSPTLAQIEREGGTVIARHGEPFNWALFNNQGASDAREPLLLFVNDDVTFLTQHWDLLLREAFADPRIGAAGARLLYPDGRLQHGGILLGVDGATEHEGRGAESADPGPWQRWVRRRRATAVTGAFLACRQESFRMLGGFDAEGLPVWFNDVDYCLKLRAAGQRVLFLGDVEAIHQESATLARRFDTAARDAVFALAKDRMRSRWGAHFAEDGSYNPHYARIGAPFAALVPPSLERIEAWVAGQLPGV